jgi:hypothetical protein
MWMVILTITFCSLTKGYWTPYVYRQLHVLFWISQSTYFGIRFHFLLIWVPHGNSETYICIIYKSTVQMSICAKKKICTTNRWNMCGLQLEHGLRINAGPLPLPPDFGVQAKYSVELRFAVVPTATAWQSLTLIHVLLQIRQTYWCIA